jgi:hypothetical protein
MQDRTINFSGPRFGLFANPFHILGMDPTASDSQVQSAYAAAVGRDPAAAQDLADARGAILDPSRRLSCELAFPTDSPPAQVKDLYASLLEASPQQALIAAGQLAPLSRANFLAHLAAQGPPESALLLAFLDAHVAIDVTELYTLLKSRRNQARWPTPSLVNVSEGLRNLFNQHAMSVILGCDDVENLARPLLECTQSILATADPYRIEALNVLLDVYRLASTELRSKLDQKLQYACAELQQRPDNASAIQGFTKTVDRWISLYRPLILPGQKRNDPDVGTATRRIRGLLAGVSLDQQYSTTRTLLDLAYAATSFAPGDIERFSQAPVFLEPLGHQNSSSEKDSAKVRGKTRLRSAKWLAVIFVALFGGAISVAVYQFYIAPPRAPAQAIAVSASSVPALGPELLPPVGKGQHLTQNYVRYCRFQEERLRIIKARIRGADDRGAFNVLANDYNSRCADFFFLDDDANIVNDELIAKRNILEDDALRIMATWPWRARPEGSPAR